MGFNLDSAVLSSFYVDSELISKSSSLGLDVGDFDGKYKAAYEFLIQYYEDYKELPSKEHLIELCGIELEDLDVEPKYALREFTKRRLFRHIRSGQTEIDDSLRKNDPELALQKMHDILESASVVGDIVPTSLFTLGQDVVDWYKDVEAGKRGIPYPWESLNLMNQGMWPGTVTFFVGRPNTGKCVCEDTLVMDSNSGKYLPIKDIVAKKSSVLSRLENGEICSVEPSAFLDTGHKECLRVKLRSGKVLDATPEHPLMTVDGWKRLESLRVGDFIETVRKVPEPKSSVSVSKHESVLISGMLAEGGYSANVLSFTNSDKEIAKSFVEAVRFFGCNTVKHQGASPYDYFVVDKNSKGNHVRFIMDMYEMGKRRSRDKKIPDKVFSYDNESLSVFLGFLWSCDGSIEKRGVISYSSASEELIDGVQRLLLRFGILSKKRHKIARCKGKEFDAYEIVIFSTCRRLFCDNIPLVGVKKVRADALSFDHHPKVDNIPVSERVKDVFLTAVSKFSSTERGRIFRGISDELGIKSRLTPNKFYRRGTVSRRVFSAMIDGFGIESLKHLGVNSWDEIVEIEKIGVRHVYDLTVLPDHSFIANDIVVHNSMIAVICARHAWMEGRRVLVVSPEMSKTELAERFFVIESNVSYRNIVAGTLSGFEMKKLQGTVDDLSEESGIWIVDSDDELTPSALENAIVQTKPDLVAIDSVYDVEFPGSRMERMPMIATWLKNSSKRYGIPFCVFSQLNKSVEKKAQGGSSGPPSMGGVALSDQVNWDAHNIFAMEQTPDMRADKLMNLHPIKIRRGSFNGEPVELEWDFDLMKFNEVGDDPSDKFGDDTDGDLIPF